MVTASTCFLTLIGASGRTYSVQGYLADVVGTSVKFDDGSTPTASSLPFWKVPEQCTLRDLAVVTGNTVTTVLAFTADGNLIPSARLPEASFLNTLATRPPLNVGFKAGTNLGAKEA